MIGLENGLDPRGNEKRPHIYPEINEKKVQPTTYNRILENLETPSLLLDVRFPGRKEMFRRVLTYTQTTSLPRYNLPLNLWGERV